MSSFKENLEKIIIPFREEWRQKCRNESVIGGFDRYVIDWTDRAILKAPSRSEERKNLEEVKKRMRDYKKLLPRQRGELLKEVHPVIKSLMGEKSGEKIEEQPLPISASGSLHNPPPFKGSKRPTLKKIPKSDKKKIADKLTGEGLKSVKLESPVNSLKNVGPRVTSMLQKAGIRTIEDLLYHFPRDYQDRRKIAALNNVKVDSFQVVRGKLVNVVSRKMRGKLHLTKAVLMDDTGTISLTWFNQPYMKNLLKRNKQYIASGKVEFKYGQLQINTPEIEELEEIEIKSGITPVYPLTEGISQKFMRKIIESSLRRYSDLLTEVFPPEFLKRLDLPDVKTALKNVHVPKTLKEIERAVLRFRFEEAFFLQLIIGLHRRSFRERDKKRNYGIDEKFVAEFEEGLPFKLTESQKNVIEEITEDLHSPMPMNRLLQGDVGSGKTVVCVFGALATARAGYQAAIMAPTEILAEQHYYRFRDFLKPYGVEVRLLVGATPASEKDEIKGLLSSGELSVVVGTHALIQEDVSFKDLAFAVVDEQHRFGVMQRTTLKEKGNDADFLFTTATPIPRSLCLTVYGDLEVSVIDELPPGRQPVKTMWVPEEEKERVYNFVEKEMNKGGQVYVVCPLIEESEKIDATPLTDEFEKISARFPDKRAALLHGRMKSYEKEEVMKAFSDGEVDVLVSTTVIEVGVDVPGATLMVILDANRYGLGQLHQLRGRVGRGKDKSYCILISSGKGPDSNKRLETIVEHNSGFDIAEADLQIRGPGDFAGVRQSGLPDLKFLDILRDYKVIVKAREESRRFIEDDPEFSKKEHHGIKEKLQGRYKNIWDILH